jgi:hypothetical protein
MPISKGRVLRRAVSGADNHGSRTGHLAEMKENIGQGGQNEGNFFVAAFSYEYEDQRVLFPDTVPSERMLIPLVQVFGQLVYFQAVENDAFPAGLHSELCEAMVAGVALPH